jgi:hypothetical protein
VRGSSPRGVGFTLVVGEGSPTIDDAGNPGSPPRRLARTERATIEACAEPR